MLYFFKILMAPYRIPRKNMRQKTRKPIDEMQIDQVQLDAHSRDDIPQLLKGLQYQDFRSGRLVGGNTRVS